MSIQDLNEKDFNEIVLKSEKPVIVDFWAPWCGPCRALHPILEEMSQDLKEEALIVKINVDNNPNLSMAYQVRSIPTLVFFHQGQLKGRLVGVLPKNNIVDEFRRTIKS